MKPEGPSPCSQETHPASYSMRAGGGGGGGPFLRGKAARAWRWPIISIWCRGQE
jgi:hypothetical protein